MNTLSDQIITAIKEAMKARDAKKLAVLRSLKSSIQNTIIEKYGADGTLDDAEVIAVIRKAIKQRQDSLASYEGAGREDLAVTEREEIALLEAYLPAPLSPEEIDSLISDAIAETGASSKKDMGAVMKIVQERAAGRADGKTLSQAVSARLP